MASKVVAFFVMRLQLIAYVMIQIVTLITTILLLSVFMFLPLSAIARWWEQHTTTANLPKPDLTDTSVN